MASLLKQRMSNQQFFYPLLNWERPYDGDITTELNIERYDLRKDGAIGFSHPNGTHDDVFWATALAIYATVEMAPEPFLAVIPRIMRRVQTAVWLHRLRRSMLFRRA